MIKILAFLIASFSIVNAVTFTCYFQDDAWVEVDNQYNCLVDTLGNLDEPELTAVYGTHLSGKSNSDVGTLSMYGQNLTFFPQRIENFFPNLAAIYFNGNNISSLNGDELNFPNLVLFGLNDNPALERIPGNLFSSTRNLQTVYLDNNNIKHVGEGLLDGLNLNEAYFWNNYCIDQYAEYNSTELAALIETLNNNCTDSETTTTTPEPACGDTNEVVCNLQEQNKEILAKNQILIVKNANLEEKVEQLVADNEELKLKIENMQTEMNEKFDQVLEGILELSTRP
jgi:hypothetical protein